MTQKLSNFIGAIRFDSEKGTRQFGDEFKLKTFHLTTKNKAHLELVESKLSISTWQTAKEGSGAFAYNGKSNDDKSVFLGSNSTLKSHRITFSGENSTQYLKIVASTVPKDILNSLKASQVNFSCGLKATDKMNALQQFESAADEILFMKKEKNEKAAKKVKKTFVVGQKGSVQCIVFSPVQATSVELLSGIEASVSLKGSLSQNLWVALVGTPNVHLEVLYAFFFFQALLPYQSNLLLDFFRDFLRKFDLGNVVIPSKSTVQLNPSIKYVRTALKTVEKRLNDPVLSLQVQDEFYDFAEKVFSSPNTIVDYQEFYERFNSIFNKKQSESISRRSSSVKLSNTSTEETSKK